MGRLARLHQGRTAAVIAYQAAAPLLIQLRRFCTRHRIALVSDIVEWYDPRHVIGGRFGPFAWDSELRMRWLTFKSDGIIAISRFLEDYYRPSGVPVIRIPPLLDLESLPGPQDGPSRAGGGAVRLAFAGTAARKDLLTHAIRGLALLGEEGERCRITVVGPAREEIRAALGRDGGLVETLEGRLEFTGRLPHGQALERLRACDFSILLRPGGRVSQAGFPTKLVESLAAGVPVICNLTGDIGLYVKDGQEGLVVPDASPESFAQGLRRALALSDGQRQGMRQAARRRAEGVFDYRNWVEPAREFMAGAGARLA